jgi:DNA replication protein DnaC
VLGNATYADAILDRIVHTAHRIELCGESMRKRGTANAEEAARPATTSAG